MILTTRVILTTLCGFVWAGVCGCGSQPEPSPAGTANASRPAATAPTARTPAPSATQTPHDRSLTPLEYTRLGLPADDRPWLPGEFTRAGQVLTAVADRDPGQLPRYRSDRSGRVFARITAADSLDAYRDRTLTIDARLIASQAHTEGLNRIAKAYLGAFLKGGTGDDETVELTGAQLRLVAAVMGLVDEFVPTIEPNDPDRPTRMAALEGLKRDVAGTISSVLTLLSDPRAYQTEQRVRLVGYMRNAFPTLAPKLLNRSREEIAVRLEQMASDPGHADIHPGLVELQTVVRASGQPRGAP